MFKKDSIYIGIVYALILPLLFFIPVYFLVQKFDLDMHTQSFLFIIGVALNLILMRRANKERKEFILKGILLVSFLYAILFCYFKFKGLA